MFMLCVGFRASLVEMFMLCVWFRELIDKARGRCVNYSKKKICYWVYTNGVKCNI